MYNISYSPCCLLDFTVHVSHVLSEAHIESQVELCVQVTPRNKLTPTTSKHTYVKLSRKFKRRNPQIMIFLVCPSLQVVELLYVIVLVSCLYFCWIVTVWLSAFNFSKVLYCVGWFSEWALDKVLEFLGILKAFTMNLESGFHQNHAKVSSLFEC